MSLEDGRTGFKEPLTNRRVGPSQTEGQRIASVENFAIFLLKGIQSAIQNPRAAAVFSTTTIRHVMDVTDWEIERIKHVQELRAKVKRDKGGN